MKQYPILVQHLLRTRGITTAKGAENFFACKYSLHDPFAMRGMSKAVERIKRAVVSGELIMIHGDYDADGVCASALMHSFFSVIGYTNFYVVIPHRSDDGYGISESAITRAKEKGVSLIITVDCGITAMKEVDLANKLGIDVVITDHHLPPIGSLAGLPQAYAVINPHKSGDTYPFKELCGTGIAFTLVRALLERGGYNVVNGWEKWLLDMVAIATVADVMPLVRENRILVRYGLQVLSKTRSLGLRLLCERLKVNLLHITEDDVSFMIAPALNVAGRMDHADIAFTLLTTKDYEVASDTVNYVLSLKAFRKQTVADIMGAITIDEVPNVIVVGDASWHQGVLGLVAARLAETYHRPAFVWGRGDVGDITSRDVGDITSRDVGTIRGSARSDGSVNLQELVTHVPKNIFYEFGGHEMAAGFSLNSTDDTRLRVALNKAYEKTIIMKRDDVMADAVIQVDDISWALFSIVDQFAPFGAGNPKPLFSFKELSIRESSLFGKARDHLKLRFNHGAPEDVFAIAFFANDEWRYRVGDVVDVLGSLEKNVFRGKQELRIRIHDVGLHDE